MRPPRASASLPPMLRAVAAFLLFVLTAAVPASAAPGDLDPDFGEHGIASVAPAKAFAPVVDALGVVYFLTRPDGV